MQADRQENREMRKAPDALGTHPVGAFAGFAGRRLPGILLRLFLVLYFVVVAVFLGVRYLVLPNIGRYAADIQKMASESVGSPVTFSQIEASWYGLQPKIDLRDVRVADREGNEVVRLEHVSAVVSWWTVPMMEMRLSLLQIDKPDIGIVRDGEGQFYVAGIRIGQDRQEKGGMADWLLKQQEIRVLDGKLHWKDGMRGNADLNLEQVNFVLDNRGARHKFRLTAQPDSGLAQSLDIRGDMQHSPAQNKASDLSGWKGELYAALPDMNIAEWKKLVDFPVGLDSGRGSVQAWVTLDSMQMASLTADIDGQDIRLAVDRTVPALEVRRLAGRISVESVKRQPLEGAQAVSPVYNYGVHNLSLETAKGEKLDGASLSVMLVPGKTDLPDEMAIEIGKLDIGELGTMLPYIPLSQDIRREIGRYEFSGKLTGFQVDWKTQPENRSTYHVRGRFDGLTFKKKHNGNDGIPGESGKTETFVQKLPGFENLSGSVSANNHGGNLELASSDAALILPLYPEMAPQRFDELAAQLQWEQKPGNGLSVQIGKLSILQNGMRAYISGRYALDTENSADRYGFVDATAQIKNLKIADIRQYIPVQTPKALHEWLSAALKDGEVSEGTVRIKGNLADFPFNRAGAEGLFTVNAKLVDSVLNYTPNMLSADRSRPLWPDIDKIQGEFRMNGSLLAIHADSASTNDVPLKNVDVVIPDVLSDKPYLDIKGDAEGTLQKMVGFVNLSPVTGWIGHLTEKTEATGNASLALALQLPLDAPEKTTVSGTLQFSDNDIVLLEDLPVIAGTQGRLRFYEKGFGLENIRGRFLHEPVTVSGGTQPNGRFLVRAEGTLSGKGLQQTYPSGMMGRLMQKVSGKTPYSVHIANGEIQVKSNLKGLKIGLPSPLGKPAEQNMPLSVVLKDRPASGTIARDELDIAYGSGMGARYLRQKDRRGGAWHIVRGGIGINRQVAVRDGLSLDVSLHNLDLNEWQDVLKNLTAGTGNNGKHAPSSGSGLVQYLYPHHFTIAADELAVMEAPLLDAHLSGTYQTGYWDIDIHSRQIDGKLKWIESTGGETEGKLVARLKYMNVLRSSMKKVSDTSGRDDIVRIPSVDIVADDLTLFDMHLGKAEIVANNIIHANGKEWRVDRLKITNPDAVLEASGNWMIGAGNQQQTKLGYVLDIKDAGKLLARFGYSDLIKQGHGEMKGDLGWKGLPFVLDIPSLSGKLSLKVEKGQFLKADPGAAKLLSVISLQSLPNRLSLDFRDIFAKGFAFDEITAHAEITNGVMQTQNMKMNGVNATVMMDGSIDIAQEAQDLHVVVIPEINAAAASIAYGFINPAIGVGTFLAQMFLREPLMKQFTHEYRITGSWRDPTVTEIGKEKHKENQITEKEQP